MSCKKWIKIVVIILISCIGCISAFNYIIDSAKLFGKHDDLIKVANHLNNGNMVAGLKNYDERKLQEFVIKNRKEKIDVTVIGASTTLHIRQKSFPNHKFLNNSVSGAYIEDIISILGIYQMEQKYIPKVVILGLVPEMFVSEVTNSRYQSIFKYYKYFLNILHLDTNETVYDLSLSKFKQLFNMEYTLENIDSFNKINYDSFYLVKDSNVDDYIKEQDGSIHYPHSTKFKKTHDIEKFSENSINDGFYGEVKHASLNQVSLKRFNRILSYLKTKNIKVIFYLSPFNPHIYNQLTKQYKGIVFSENIIKSIAKKHNIKIYGSFDPNVFKLKSNDFYDSMHSKENVSNKILNTIEKDL